MEWELLGIVLIGLYAFIGYLFHFPPRLPYSFHLSTRDDRLDQMRGLAMIGIVCIHIHSYFEYFHPTDRNITIWTLFLSNLSRFSVPVFIFGSSLYLKKKEGYWKNKFMSLLIPYTIASIFGYLIKYQNLSIGDFLVKYSTGQVFAPFYFVPLLVQFYFLFYILPERFKKGKNILILLGLSILLNVISNLNGFNNLFPDWYKSISILNFVFFFTLGLTVRAFPIDDHKIQKLSTYSLLFLYLCAFGILFTISNDNINLKNHHLTYPLLSILILNQLLPSESKGLFSILLNFIGKNSLFIFLIHPFVIHQMHAFDPIWFVNPFIGYLITLILNVGIPCLIAYSITYLSKILSNR